MSILFRRHETSDEIEQKEQIVNQGVFGDLFAILVKK